MDIELESLGQVQIVRVVDHVGHTAHVIFPRVRTCLSTSTNILLAPKCSANFGAAGPGVDIGDTAVAS